MGAFYYFQGQEWKICFCWGYWGWEFGSGLTRRTARERAIAAAIRACQEINVQFLDQTVSLESLKPVRNTHGHVVLRRIYAFEYSVQGVERRQGRAILRGQRLEQVQLDSDEGTTIEQHE